MIALLRTEAVKALRRPRTLIVAALLAGLPTLIVVAIKSHSNRRDDGEALFLLARQSGLLVPPAVLSIMSAFLLVVIAGMLAGDSVAGDASWGNLRYLLMRPVGRVRLLVAKATVAGLAIAAAVVVVAVAGLLAGVVAFGSHAVTVPAIGAGATGSTFSLSVSTILARDLVAIAYVAFGFTALLAIGTFFSTLTDAPTGAISATVGVYIVSEILDTITSLGSIRYGFPTHYREAWQSIFTADRYSGDMMAGVAVQLVYLAVFGTAAAVWFDRKDIRS